MKQALARNPSGGHRRKVGKPTLVKGKATMAKRKVNKKRQPNKARTVVVNRAKNPHHRVRHHRRRNPETGFIVAGLVAAVAAVVINKISPAIPILGDSGITGAIKRAGLGVVGRQIAKMAGLSAQVADGIATGGVVAGGLMALGNLGGAQQVFVPVPAQAQGAVPAAQIQAAAAGGGVGNLRQFDVRGALPLAGMQGFRKVRY